MYIEIPVSEGFFRETHFSYFLDSAFPSVRSLTALKPRGAPLQRLRPPTPLTMRLRRIFSFLFVFGINKTIYRKELDVKFFISPFVSSVWVGVSLAPLFIVARTRKAIEQIWGLYFTFYSAFMCLPLLRMCAYINRNVTYTSSSSSNPLSLTHGCVLHRLCFPVHSTVSETQRNRHTILFFFCAGSDNAASYSVEPNQTRLFTSPEKLRALDIFVSFSIKVNAQAPALPHSLLFWSSSSSLRSRTFHGTAPQSWMLYIQQMNVSRAAAAAACLPRSNLRLISGEQRRHTINEQIFAININNSFVFVPFFSRRRLICAE